MEQIMVLQNSAVQISVSEHQFDYSVWFCIQLPYCDMQLWWRRIFCHIGLQYHAVQYLAVANFKVASAWIIGQEATKWCYVLRWKVLWISQRKTALFKRNTWLQYWLKGSLLEICWNDTTSSKPYFASSMNRLIRNSSKDNAINCQSHEKSIITKLQVFSFKSFLYTSQ